MIIGHKFVFTHYPKCAGQSISKAIRENIGSIEEIRSHTPFYALPKHHQVKSCFGVIRNPWAWYVTWYFYNRTSKFVNPLFLAVSDNGKLDFSNTIENLINFKSDSEMKAKALVLADNYMTDFCGRGWSHTLIKRFIESNMGYMSFVFNELFKGASDLVIAPLFDMKNQLNIFFKKQGYNCEINLPHINTTQHGPALSYYSDNLKQRVYDYEKDLHLVKAFTDDCREILK